MRLALLLVVLAGCPQRPDPTVELAAVDARAIIQIEGDGDPITLAGDGRVWLGARRTTPAALGRPHDPTVIEPACTRTEPSCIGFPHTFEADGRLVAGHRGRQYGWRRIVGEVRYDGVMMQDTRVFAAPDADARILVDIVHATGGAIMVQGGALRLDFTDRDAEPAARIATIRLERATDVVRALEATPHTMPCGERELIFPVHLIVAEGVTVQALVDAIVALDLAGVRMVGLGNA